MRKEYLDVWKDSVLRHADELLPDFMYGKGSKARSMSPTKSPTTAYFYKQLDYGLEAYVDLKAIRSDNFWCTLSWAENGERPKAEPLINLPPFHPEILASPCACTDMQRLSYYGDPQGERLIGYYVLSGVEIGDDVGDQEAFSAFLDDEMRTIPDEEARAIVDKEVVRAMNDVRRLACPWFDAKVNSLRSR